jgi:hypothetical protein
MSLAARLLNVLALPGDVFAEVRAALPSVGNWLAPGLMLLLVGWISATVILAQPSIRQQMREVVAQALDKQFAKTHVPKEQAEQARAMAEKFAGVSQGFGLYVAPVLAGFGVPFLWGLILWLVGTKVFHASFPYMKAVEVAGLAGVISLLETIVKTLLAVGLGNLFASPSAALLVKDFDPQNSGHILLALVNPFTAWVLAVRALGLARLSGAPFAKAVLWVVGLWAAYTIFTVGPALAVNAAFGR